jgi:hypothetical protein
MAVLAYVEPSVAAEATCDNVAPGLHEARRVTGIQTALVTFFNVESAVAQRASVSSSEAVARACGLCLEPGHSEAIP